MLILSGRRGNDSVARLFSKHEPIIYCYRVHDLLLMIMVDKEADDVAAHIIANHTNQLPVSMCVLFGTQSIEKLRRRNVIYFGGSTNPTTEISHRSRPTHDDLRKQRRDKREDGRAISQ